MYSQGRTTTSDPLVSLACAGDEQLRKFPETLVITAQYDYLTVGADHVAKRGWMVSIPAVLSMAGVIVTVMIIVSPP